LLNEDSDLVNFQQQLPPQRAATMSKKRVTRIKLPGKKSTVLVNNLNNFYNFTEVLKILLLKLKTIILKVRFWL
jgi:hypothetical protein